MLEESDSPSSSNRPSSRYCYYLFLSSFDLGPLTLESSSNSLLLLLENSNTSSPLDLGLESRQLITILPLLLLKPELPCYADLLDLGNVLGFSENVSSYSLSSSGDA